MIKSHSDDITFDINDRFFLYRVGAIIIDNGEILMAKSSDEDATHYFSVGGRVQLGETAQEAVLREAREETGIALEIDRPGYIHENFFVLEENNKPYHEIAMFFFMKPHKDIRRMTPTSFDEDAYGKILLHWLPIADLKDIQLYPEFFKTELASPSKEIKHFVTRDGKTTVLTGN